MFEQFKNALCGKDYNKDKKFDQFIFCRFLGSDPRTIKYGNFLNYYNLPDEIAFLFIQKSKTPGFIRWISTNSKKSEISELCKKYKINPKLALEYQEILNANKIQR